jgi:hypothetical protein
MSKNTQRRARKSSKKIHFQSGAKGLTSQAGLVPVVKFLNRVGVPEAMDTLVSHRRGDSAVYTLTDVMLLTLVGLIGGATSFCKTVAVWSDSVLRHAGGWLRIPDDSTFGRIFKETNEEQIVLLESLNHRLRGRIWKMALRSGVSKIGVVQQILIDVDSTVKTVFGYQEGATKGYNPHKRGALSYHPLIAFCCDTKEIMQAWYRTGNAYTSNGVVEFMKQLLSHLPRRVRIVFRGDSGFFVGALLALLERLGHGYLIKVKLKKLVALLEPQEWTSIPDNPGWEQCEFQHKCSSWEKTRRFVAVRVEQEEKPEAEPKLLDIKQYDYFCYVTTEPLSPWATHKKYGKRATCETWIEEAKNQMGLGQIKTDNFLANAAIFQCAVLAYNTVRWMALMSGSAKLRRWEIQTVRVFLVRVAGKLLTGSNQPTIKTPKDHLYPEEWADWVTVGLGM